jgi:hypothetical protein
MKLQSLNIVIADNLYNENYNWFVSYKIRYSRYLSKGLVDINICKYNLYFSERVIYPINKRALFR